MKRTEKGSGHQSVDGKMLFLKSADFWMDLKEGLFHVPMFAQRGYQGARTCGEEKSQVFRLSY